MLDKNDIIRIHNSMQSFYDAQLEKLIPSHIRAMKKSGATSRFIPFLNCRTWAHQNREIQPAAVMLFTGLGRKFVDSEGEPVPIKKYKLRPVYDILKPRAIAYTKKVLEEEFPGKHFSIDCECTDKGEDGTSTDEEYYKLLILVNEAEEVEATKAPTELPKLELTKYEPFEKKTVTGPTPYADKAKKGKGGASKATVTETKPVETKGAQLMANSAKDHALKEQAALHAAIESLQRENEQLQATLAKNQTLLKERKGDLKRTTAFIAQCEHFERETARFLARVEVVEETAPEPATEEPARSETPATAKLMAIINDANKERNAEWATLAEAGKA